MTGRQKIRAALTLAIFVCPLARAAEHITLRNGFELNCTRQESSGDRVRLYLMPASTAESTNYIEVSTDAIVRTEAIPDPAPAPPTPTLPPSNLDLPVPSTATLQIPSLTPAEMHEMLARAGTLHNIDADLLASVVHAESNGNVRAVSRAGARGLMQLMPGTANDLGVADAFAPEQNIGGGTAYLDALLTRYHDNIALALAAYNAGPAAVDRFHGIPPYAETRAYVARILREFNRRKLAGVALAPLPATQLTTRLAAK